MAMFVTFAQTLHTCKYIVRLLIDFRERCDEGSVLVLERMIEDLDIEWECFYDPM